MIKRTLLLLTLVVALFQTSFAQTAEPHVTPLPTGSKFPTVVLNDIDNKQVALNKLIAAKPSVVIFYRGGWCPYCNAHLADIGKAEKQILAMGYQVIAISPDVPSKFQGVIDKHELKYTLLSDADTKLMQALGIAYQAPEPYVKLLAESSAGKNKGLLPAPSVFILDKKGKILFEHVDVDFKKRMSSEELLAELKKYK